MTTINKDNYIQNFFSDWLKVNTENWDLFLTEIEGDGKNMFSTIINGDLINKQVCTFLNWLLDISKHAEQTSIIDYFKTHSNFLIEIKKKKQDLLIRLPEIEPINKSSNIDYIKSQIYSLYNTFFDIARQIEEFSYFSEDTLLSYVAECKRISIDINKLHNAINFKNIYTLMREINPKLTPNQKQSIAPLKDFINQLTGWSEDRLFAFNNNLFPEQFLSIDEFTKELNFQYNYLEAKSKCLNNNYYPIINPLVIETSRIWHAFQKFYKQYLKKCHFALVVESSNKDPLPIRAHFLMGNIQEMIQSLRSVFASVPSSIFKIGGMQESHFHIAMHTIFKVLQLCPYSEITSSKGRLDMMINNTETIYDTSNVMSKQLQKDTKRVMYIFEFKTTKSNKNISYAALRQIKKRDYGFSHKDDFYRIYGVGLCFSIKEKNILNTEIKPTILYENGIRQFVL